MENKQLVGIVGAVIVFLGVFSPVDSLPLLGAVSFLGKWNVAGTLALVLAALSLGAALYDQCRWLWATGGASLALVAGTGVYHVLNRPAERVAAGQWHWGWAVLVCGALVIIGAAAWHERLERG